jgi:hypothetical protein
LVRLLSNEVISSENVVLESFPVLCINFFHSQISLKDILLHKIIYILI